MNGDIYELAARRAASEAIHPSTVSRTMIVERPTSRVGLDALRVAALSLEDRLTDTTVDDPHTIALGILCDLDDHGYMLVRVADHG